MGCATSKPQQHEPVTPKQKLSPTPTASPKPVTIPTNTPNSKKTSTSANSTAKSSKQTYDTTLSASLVETGGAAVPFHGILTDAGKLNLKRITQSSYHADGKIFQRIPSTSLSSSSNSVITLSGTAMTMPYTVLLPDTFFNDVAEIQTSIDAVFDMTNQTFNGWNPKSEISTINKLAPEQKHNLSSQIISLFDIVDTVHDMTDKRFDPTSGSLSVAFENCIRDKQRPPQPSELKQLKYGLGWKQRVKRVHTKGKTTVAVMRLNGNTVIEFDGISKGHVVDLIINTIRGKHNCQNVYVEWAGDARAYGLHPEGRPWRSGIVRPPSLKRVFDHWKRNAMRDMLIDDDVKMVAQFQNDFAIATSGDYFSVLKYGFHHIVYVPDMTILKASNSSVASVSVVASTCAMADGIATAAMTLASTKEAVEFLARLRQQYSEIVLGYCVMGRQPDHDRTVAGDSHAYEIYTDEFFTPLEDKKENNTPKTRNDRTKKSTTTSPERSLELANNVRGKIFQHVGSVSYAGQTVSIDSFTSASMDPEPLVTFSVPVDFVRNARVSPTNEEKVDDTSIMECTLTNIQNSKLTVRLILRGIEKHEDDDKTSTCVIIIAMIADVSFGTLSELPIQLGPNKTVTHKITFGPNVVRSKFQLEPIRNKARILHRNIPALVWVIVAHGSDDSTYAVTATSVAVPEIDKTGVLTFNMAHSSAFYAGFSGVRSTLSVYAIGDGMQSTAAKFVTECRPTQNDIDMLKKMSVVVAECVVLRAIEVQDHTIVTTRIFAVDYERIEGAKVTPLIWLNGKYVL